MAELSAEELLSFKREGYLIRRGLLAPEHCAAARDALWAGNETPTVLRRDDPLSWVGPIDWGSEPGGPKDVGNPPAQDERSADWDNARSDFNWRYRAIGNQQPLIGIVRDTPIWDIAEQLLGAGQLIEPTVGAPWREDRTAGQQSERVRGVICNLPRPAGMPRPSVANGAHVDSQPFHCGLVVYVDDVPPGGGGFTIWPRSHLRLYRADRRFGDVVSAYNPPPKGKGSFIDDLMGPYGEVQGVVREALPHMEFHGKAGDAIFWHSRMFHAQSQNHSNPPQIRQSIIHDFAVRQIDDPDRPVEALMADPWAEWSPEIRALPDCLDVEPEVQLESRL